ncbi:hypothetical protein DFH09DRAFT_1115448 [Mycena vulgaris]|nr:hypothetical protein DFH09DRAFT_1115448 [Mycena vulgaris]
MIVVLIHFEPRIATGDSTGLVYGLSTELRPMGQVFAVFLGWHARGRFHASRVPNIRHRAENGQVPGVDDSRAAEGFFARTRIEETDSKKNPNLRGQEMQQEFVSVASLTRLGAPLRIFPLRFMDSTSLVEPLTRSSIPCVFYESASTHYQARDAEEDRMGGAPRAHVPVNPRVGHRAPVPAGPSRTERAPPYTSRFWTSARPREPWSPRAPRSLPSCKLSPVVGDRVLRATGRCAK